MAIINLMELPIEPLNYDNLSAGRHRTRR